MAVITALTEDFNGGANGTEVTTANSIFTNVGGNRLTFTTDSHPTGQMAALTPSVSVTSSLSRVDYTEVATLWFSMYFKVTVAPTAACALVTCYFTDTKIGDIRILTDSTIQLRSVSTQRAVSSAITVGQWYRLAFQFSPNSTGTGICRLKLYGGVNLDNTTHLFDSGNQTLTAPVTGSNNIRVGVAAADATMRYVMDRFRADNATEPLGLGGVTNNPPTANAGPDQTGILPGAQVTLSGTGSSDPDGTVTNHTWTQTAGPTVTLSGTGTGSRTFTAPSVVGGTTLTFSLVVTDNGGLDSTADTVNITVLSPSNTFSEDFDGGTSGTPIAPGNSIFTNVTSNRLTFTTDAYVGGMGALLPDITTLQSLSRIDYSSWATCWYGFYIKLNVATTSFDAIVTCYQDDTKVGDVRILAGQELQLRSVNTERAQTPALVVGQWYRVAVMFAPTVGGTGFCRIKLYSGSSRDSMTPTYDSGNQALTAAVATSNNIRVGAATTDATLRYSLDRLRGNNTEEPTGTGGGSAINTPPVANAGPDQTGIAPGATVTLSGSGTDTDGVIVGYNWVQTAGTPTVTLSGTGANRTFTAPSVTNGTTLTFGLVVTDDDGDVSPQDTMTVTVLAAGTEIIELREDFEGGAAGTDILTTNTIFDSDAGTGTNSTFFSPGYVGTRCMRTVSGSLDFRSYRADFTSSTRLWLGMYFMITALPTAATAILAIYSGTTKIADVRVLSGGAIELRSISTNRWTSVAVTTGIWHRLAVLAQPTVGGAGTLRLRLYEGTERDNPSVSSQDSGTQVASALIGTVDNIRMGNLSTDATLAWQTDRIRGDSVAEPVGIATVSALSANAGLDQANIEPYSTVTVTASAAGGTAPYSYAWSAAPTITLTGTGASRTFTAPATIDGISHTLTVTVTDASGLTATDSMVTTTLRHDRFTRRSTGWVPSQISRI